MNWRAQVTVAPAPAPAAAPSLSPELTQLGVDLVAAADRFQARTDSFAEGKAFTCRDLAVKLGRFHTLTEKQIEFAKKLIVWSVPRAVAPVASFPETARLLFNTLKGFYTPAYNLVATRDKSKVWIIETATNHAVAAFFDGKAEVTLFTKLFADYDFTSLLELLRKIEADPMGSAIEFGKLSGVCAICGLRLLNDKSIARGIGPICAGRLS